MRMRLARRTIQGLTLILLIAIPVLNKNGILLITGSLYSLSIGPIWLTDPLSGVQVILATLNADKTLLLSMALPLLLTLVLGRVFCGWACPQNTISELFDFLSNKLRMKRLFRVRLSPLPRYAVLTLLLIATPLVGIPLANLIHAPGIISVQISKYVYESAAGLEAGLIVLIITAELVLIRRIWCNFLCPVGSFLGVFRIKRTMRVVFTEDAAHPCSGCDACGKACGLGLAPREGNIYPLCHNCGACVAACKQVCGERKPLSFSWEANGSKKAVFYSGRIHRIYSKGIMTCPWRV